MVQKLLGSRKTFQELGVVAIRIVKASGRLSRECIIWLNDGRILKDIVA